MTLTELRYVVAVAEHQHFGRAATACYVSQPTLSVGIRKLEEELGVRIFERSRSDVLITPIGRELVAQARTILDAAVSLKETASAAQDPLGQGLNLGAIYTIGPLIVPRLIPGFMKLAPQLSLTVTEDFTDGLAERLKRGELDAAIMSLPFSDPRIVSRPLYEEPFVVAVPAAHPLARRQSLSSAQLADETLLLLGARNCFREQVLEICPHCHPSRSGKLQKTLEGSSLETICQMVAAGAGITILPSTLRINEDLNPHLKLLPFRRPVPTRTVAVFYRRGFARPELINLIARAVREAGVQGVEFCA
jgi:LysR family hydrogen peroxide-inducible transcriptional activator